MGDYSLRARGHRVVTRFARGGRTNDSLATLIEHSEAPKRIPDLGKLDAMRREPRSITLV